MLCLCINVEFDFVDFFAIDGNESVVDIVGPDDAFGVHEHLVYIGVADDLVDFERHPTVGLSRLEIHHKNAQSIGRNDDKVLLRQVEHLRDRITDLGFIHG